MSDEYLKTLLRYYEEEVAGEAYFYQLQMQFPDPDHQQKLRLLAEVEHHSAKAVEPLVKKYGLTPQNTEDLHEQGRLHVSAHENWSWMDLINYMIKRYPLYLDDFAYLEGLAPTEDRPPLKFLTQHEVAAIEFANNEATGATDSARPLKAYLNEVAPAPLA